MWQKFDSSFEKCAFWGHLIKNCTEDFCAFALTHTLLINKARRQLPSWWVVTEAEQLIPGWNFMSLFPWRQTSFKRFLSTFFPRPCFFPQWVYHTLDNTLKWVSDKFLCRKCHRGSCADSAEGGLYFTRRGKKVKSLSTVYSSVINKADPAHNLKKCFRNLEVGLYFSAPFKRNKNNTEMLINKHPKYLAL